MKKSKNKPKREPQSRVWFLGHGFHPVPPTEYIRFKILYAHESDLRFVNKYGQELSPSFSPFERNPKVCHGHPVPRIVGRLCHIIRALAFYGERKVFIDEKTGKSYFGQCHHLNGDLEDHRKDNILAWLSRPQHRIADKRQDALQTIVPNGNLVGFDYAILRELQDPRTMSDADFETRMEYLRIMHECGFDPRIFNADDFHYWFSMPFDEFKNIMYKQKID